MALLGESALTCWLTLWGIRMYWLGSSAEPTLVPWRVEQLDCLDNSLLPLFLTLPVIDPLFRMQFIHELANYYRCIYHKLNLGRSSQNKTEKRKAIGTFN